MTKAVIFDLDGLLIDSEMIYYQIEVDFLKNMAIRSLWKSTRTTTVEKR